MDRKHYTAEQIIDHVLVNLNAKQQISMNKASIYLPGQGDVTKYAEWRQTYSDHFPVSFEIEIDDEDDDVDYL